MTKKNTYLPRLMLAALLLAASLTLFAGVKMAREESVVRTEVGREEIGDFSADMMAQLARLDDLYEGHLRDLASMNLGDRFALRKACDRIVGLKQFAVAVDVKGGANGARAFQENFSAGWRGVPILPGQPEPALGGELFMLSPDELVAGSANGWIDRPGVPLMFWQRRTPGVYVVVTPEVEEVEAALHGWLGEWVLEVREPLVAAAAEVVVSGKGGAVHEFVPAGELQSAGPDVVVPMRSRFGGWKLSAWDKREVVVSYDALRLAMAVGGAVVFALLGVGGFVVLRRALRLSEQRVSFVNRVSHELRTPLTNILLNNDLAADAVEMGDPEAASGRMSLIREEAARLSRLIANVLTFSRSGQDPVPVGQELFAVGQMVERTLAPFLASLGRKKVAVKVNVPDTLIALGDVDLAMQILANLVSNVEKYASSGGRLAVVGEEVLTGDQPLTVLRISDLGPGIPRPARERVFEPFVRLSERVDEGVSGTGLGLSIARDLARKMGGDLLLLESERGAEFELRLPAAPGNVVSMEGVA